MESRRGTGFRNLLRKLAPLSVCRQLPSSPSPFRYQKSLQLDRCKLANLVAKLLLFPEQKFRDHSLAFPPVLLLFGDRSSVYPATWREEGRGEKERGRWEFPSRRFYLDYPWSFLRWWLEQVHEQPRFSKNYLAKPRRGNVPSGRTTLLLCSFPGCGSNARSGHASFPL